MLSVKNDRSGGVLLGNGRSFFSFDGMNVRSVTLGSYDAPLAFDILHYHSRYEITCSFNTLSPYSARTSFYMSRRPGFGGSFIDLVTGGSYIRLLESKLRMRFWIKSDGLLSAVYHEKYRFGRSVARCVSYDTLNEHGNAEHPAARFGRRLYLLLFGDAEYSEGAVCFGGGRAAAMLYFGTPSGLRDELAARYPSLIKSFVSGDTSLDDVARAHREPGDDRRGHPLRGYPALASGIARELSRRLLAAQSEQGGMLDVDRVSSINSVENQFYYLTALLMLGELRRARKLISYYFDIWTLNGGIGSYTYSRIPRVPFGAYAGSGGLAFILTSVMQYYEFSGDTAFMLKFLPMIGAIAGELCKRADDGTIPFDPTSEAFVYGTLPAELSSYGSAEGTLFLYMGMSRLLEFIRATPQAHAAVPRTETARYQKLVWEIEESFRRSFCSEDGVFYLNSANRFRGSAGSFGCCQRCAQNGRDVYIGWLERTKNGLYVCPECYSDNIKQLRAASCNVERIPTPHIPMLALFCGFPGADREFCHRAIESYDMLVRTEIYVRDLALLCLCRKSDGDASWSELLALLIKRLESDEKDITFADRCFCFCCICKCLNK